MSKAKQLVKIGLVAAMASMYSNGVSAASISGDANALIIVPLTLAQVSGLDFGTIAPTAAAGSVALDTGGGRTPTNVDLITAGAGAAGEFDIQGENGTAYTITYPATAVLSNGTQTMLTSGFNDNAVALDGTLQRFQIGATLAVGANQAAGAYDTTQAGSTKFTVTANYN